MTILLILCGIFAFISVRRIARLQAEETARETSSRLAEEAANRYLQEHLSEIVEEYAKFMAGMDTTSDTQANLIAEEESHEGG